MDGGFYKVEINVAVVYVNILLHIHRNNFFPKVDVGLGGTICSHENKRLNKHPKHKA